MTSHHTRVCMVLHPRPCLRLLLADELDEGLHRLGKGCPLPSSYEEQALGGPFILVSNFHQDLFDLCPLRFIFGTSRYSYTYIRTCTTADIDVRLYDTPNERKNQKNCGHQTFSISRAAPDVMDSLHWQAVARIILILSSAAVAGYTG